MKRKFNLQALWICALALCLSACSQLWNDPDYPTLYETMAKVESLGDEIIFLSDFQVHLSVKEDLTLGDSIKIGDRVLIHFSNVDSIAHDQWNIQLISCNKVKIKDVDVIEANESDTLTTQPLYRMHYSWISNDYLNVVFDSYSPINKESFKLVREKSKDKDTIPEISLNLRHYANNISTLWFNTQIMSFDLRPIKEEFADDSLRIQFSYTLLNENSYKNTFTQTFGYETN